MGSRAWTSCCLSSLGTASRCTTPASPCVVGLDLGAFLHISLHSRMHCERQLTTATVAAIARPCRHAMLCFLQYLHFM